MHERKRSALNIAIRDIGMYLVYGPLGCYSIKAGGAVFSGPMYDFLFFVCLLYVGLF